LKTLTARRGARGALLLRAWWCYVGTAALAVVLLSAPTASAELLSSGTGFWDMVGLAPTLPDCAPEVPQGAPAQGTGTGWLSGFVWSDDNNDGLKQSNEFGLPNVTVLLYSLDLDGGESNTKGAGDPIAWTWTDWDGSYLFTNLAPGFYKVVEEQPESFFDGQDVPGQIVGGATNLPLGNDGGFTDEKNSFVLLLPEEAYAVDFNFGEWGLTGGFASKRLLMNGNPPVIPEPSTLWLLGSAGMVISVIALRRARAARRG